MGSIGPASATGYALRGIQSGMGRVDAMASKLQDRPDDVAAIVDGKLGATQVAASAAVLRTSDEMLGTLIDTLA